MPPLIQALLLFFFLRDHPYWNPKFKRSFGVTGLVVVALFQVITFITLIASLDPDTIWLYPLLAWGAFIIGTGAALFVCYEVRILALALKRKIQLSGIWIGSQLLGVALVGGSFLMARYLGYPSVADGYSIYTLGIGTALILIMTATYWRQIEREERA
jgi:hypothetical protein